MANSVTHQGDATRREKLAEVATRPAKAQLSATELRAVAADALRRTTSQKAAAVDIGIDEGRLSHKLKDGSLTLAQLEALGPEFGAEFGRRLLAAYGEVVKTAQERARERLPEIIREILELTA